VPKVIKLFSLKQWLTLAEAARYLSILLGEDVSEADVFQLVLERELALSVRFARPAPCRIGIITKKLSNDASELFDYFLLNAKDGGILTIESDVPGEARLINWSPETVSLEGVWDLWGVGSHGIHENSLNDAPVLNFRKADGQLCGGLTEHITKFWTVSSATIPLLVEARCKIMRTIQSVSYPLTVCLLSELPRFAILKLAPRCQIRNRKGRSDDASETLCWS
jgi:hypothetical protein